MNNCTVKCKIVIYYRKGHTDKPYLFNHMSCPSLENKISEVERYVIYRSGNDPIIFDYLTNFIQLKLFPIAL